MEPLEQRVLGLLRDLAVRGHGYERWGVRGWARREDLADRLGRRIPEQLPRLHDRGLVYRADARHPVREVRPVWLYRVTSDAVRHLATLEGSEAPTIPEPRSDADEDSAAIFLPRSSAILLTGLREVAEDPRAPLHVRGEPGWALMVELRERAARLTGESRWYFPEDMAPLVDGGLAERRERAADGDVRGLLYRVTGAGRAAVVMDWRGDA